MLQNSLVAFNRYKKKEAKNYRPNEVSRCLACHFCQGLERKGLQCGLDSKVICLPFFAKF